ncbi:cation-translocating P-type ATPase [soil metagenome]
MPLPPVDTVRLGEEGLTTDEVAARVAAGLTNHVPDETSRSLWHILRANLFSLFNAIAFGSFAVLLILGAWSDALFGFFVIANVAIGVIQEFGAKRTLDKLALLNSPTTRVLRDGKVIELPRESVVLDDVVMLKPGDQLTADAVVLESTALEVDESIITGEADAVFKVVGDEVLAGASVVSGTGAARVVRVGADSFASKITADARRFSMVESELRNGIAKVIRIISFALLPVVVLVVNGQMQAAGGWEVAIQSGAWRTAAIASVASIVSLVPQGLVFMTSVAFAVGAITLSRHQVLVQELAAVEGLARVDMLCLDKTGTLTEGTVAFDAVIMAQDVDSGAITEVLAWFASDRNANATAKALGAKFDGTPPKCREDVPFSSARKWSAAAFDAGGIKGSWVLGAPEMVVPATSGSSALVSQATELASSGLRTLVLAYSASVLVVGDGDQHPLPAALRIVAVLTFREQVRPDAKATLQYFRDQGVDLRVISGDSPHTVAAVARDAGLEVLGEPFDARQLPDDPDQLSTVLTQHNVFGRVTPDQKKAMVVALQRAGHTVAMTGDGVNDAMALKQADIGIAMGSGAAATRAVARLVLLDGQFSHLPRVIDEGRRVIANVERLSKLFLTKTVFAMMLAITFGVLLWPFPFLPRQFSAVDGLTIGLPALVLALLPKAPRYVPGYLRRAARFCIPSGLTVGTALISMNVYAHLSGFAIEEIRSASVITLTIAGLGVLGILARPLTPVRIALIVAMYIGGIALFTVPFVRDFFGIGIPSTPLLVVALVCGAAAWAVVEVIHVLQVRRDRT